MCRAVGRSENPGGEARSNMVGIICRPGWYSVNWSTNPPPTPNCDSPDVVLLYKNERIAQYFAKFDFTLLQAWDTLQCAVIFWKKNILAITKHDNNIFNWLGLLLCTFTAKIISLILYVNEPMYAYCNVNLRSQKNFIRHNLVSHLFWTFLFKH